MGYLEDNIDIWTDTNIVDQRAKQFINNIKSRKLKAIVRKHFEHENHLKLYTLDNFRKDFKVYLKDPDRPYYFLPGLNERTEDILKKLLNLD